jgi:hypothetical protein
MMLAIAQVDIPEFVETRLVGIADADDGVRPR